MGLEPTMPFRTTDFKSVAYTNSATPAYNTVYLCTDGTAKPPNERTNLQISHSHRRLTDPCSYDNVGNIEYYSS